MTKAIAVRIAKKIIEDLDGRSGFDMCNVDEDTQQDMLDTWRDIVLKESNA